MEQLVTILTYAVVGMAMLIVVLLLVWWGITIKQKEKENDSKTEEPSTPTSKNDDEKQSIFKFMEFDTIDDNMIIQKKGSKFLMVIECQGINYDLMSGMEKASVEEGFVQFLNTLRNGIQIYIQTRSVNLEASIQGYKEKIKKAEEKLNRMRMQYYEMKDSGEFSKEQLDKAFFELTKQTNLYEYGRDVVANTERMSLNKNILNKKYYIVVPYYASELGGTEFDKEEIKNLAFAEVYTRAQSIINSILSCGIKSRILKTNELIELLYMSYNRDEAETFGIDKAMKAGYDEYNSTAEDVLDKKMREINRYIEEQAAETAKNVVKEVISEKQRAVENKEENMDELIRKMAEAILKENESELGKDVVNESIKELNKTKKTNENKEKKRRK